MSSSSDRNVHTVTCYRHEIDKHLLISRETTTTHAHSLCISSIESVYYYLVNNLFKISFIIYVVNN